MSSLSEKLENFFRGKKILVTGGTGSIGSNIVRQLLNFEVEEVVVFSRDEIKQFMMRRMINDERLRFVVGDVRDVLSLEKVFNNNDFDIIYHTAAMKHVVVCEENPFEAVKTNILGTENIVKLAQKYGVSKLINISTDKAVQPQNVMGATKFISERIVLNANYTSVRLGNIANTRGSVIPVLVEEMTKKKQITITDPNVTRFVMKMSEATKFILNATFYAEGGEIFIPKMKAFTLADLAYVLTYQIAPILGIRSEEIKANVIGLLRGEKMHEVLIDESELPYLHVYDDFYILRPNKPIHPKWSDVGKHLIISSNFAEKLTRDELREIIKEYIKELINKN